MSNGFTTTDAALLQKTKNWVKKGQYVFIELCACSMRHCESSRFFTQQPLEKIYSLAQPIAQELTAYLMGEEVDRRKLAQPFTELLESKAVLPAHLYEFLDKLQLFLEESLENGFNKPSGPVKQLVENRFRFYLQDTQTLITNLVPVPLIPVEDVDSRVSSFVERFLAKR